MKTLTYAEFASILESHRTCDWNPRMPSPYPDTLGPVNRRTYCLPLEASSQRYLCQRFDELFGFTECLLTAYDTLMSGEYGLQSVFDAYLKSLGVTPQTRAHTRASLPPTICKSVVIFSRLPSSAAGTPTHSRRRTRPSCASHITISSTCSRHPPANWQRSTAGSKNSVYREWMHRSIYSSCWRTRRQTSAAPRSRANLAT